MSNKLAKTSSINFLVSNSVNRFGMKLPNRKPEDKKSGSNEMSQEMQAYITAVDRDIKNIIDYVNRIPKIYIQATQPTIPSDTFSFWKDTDDSKFYLLVNIDGDQKKVELT